MRKSIEVTIQVGEEILSKWQKSIDKKSSFVLTSEEDEYFDLVKIAIENEFGKESGYYEKFKQIDKNEPFLDEEEMVNKKYFRARKKQLNLLKLLSNL